MHRPTVIDQFDDVILNPEAFSAEKSGRVLALEPKSVRLLFYFIQNRSRAIGKEELLSNIWEGVVVSDIALARVVAQFRKALNDDAKTGWFDTITCSTAKTVGSRSMFRLSPPVSGFPFDPLMAVAGRENWSWIPAPRS
jgi:DNA-binding response OmpR family regulator